MKKSTIIIFLLVSLVFSIKSQTPYKFNYQAVARNSSGNVIKNTPVKIKISILKSNILSESVYSEIHSLTTNKFGILNFRIGEGNDVSGSFENIKWGTAKYFLKVQIDINNEGEYTDMGISQMISVPYAIFSRNGVQFDMNLACNETTEGMIRYNSEDKTMEFCDGESWVEFGNGNKPTTCGEDFIDSRDGQSYPTVQIGSQCWMAKNLNFGVYKESIYENSAVGHSDVSNNGIVEKYAYDNDTSNFSIYGGLYDWNEMMNYNSTEGSQGICPDGWHIPSKAEFADLVESVGGNQIGGKRLQIGGNSGFNFELGGDRTFKGGFSPVASDAGDIWTSTTPSDQKRACKFYFTKGADNVSTHCASNKVVGNSIRCIKD